MKKSFYKMKYLIGCVVVMLLFAVQANVQAQTTSGSACLNGTGTLSAPVGCIVEDNASGAPTAFSQKGVGDGFTARGDVSWDLTNTAQPKAEICTNTDYGDETSTLLFTGFDFANLLPADPNGAMEILGVKISFERRRATNIIFNINDHSVGLVQDVSGTPTLLGSLNTSGRSDNWPNAIGGNSFTTKTYGSGTDKWGATLTRAIVADPNFGFALAVETQAFGIGWACSDIYVQNPSITVYYRVGGKWYATESGGDAIAIGSPINFGPALPTTLINTSTAGAKKVYLECSTGGSRTEYTMTVNTPPSVDLPKAEICKGESITLSPTEGGTWVSSEPTIATVTDAGVVTSVAAGTTTFTFTETATGCSATTATLTVNSNSSETITTVTPAPGFEGDLFMGLTFELSGGVAEEYNIIWPAGSFANKGFTAVMPELPAGTIMYEFDNPLVAGSYLGELQIKLADDCITQSVPFTFVVTAAPTPTEKTVCVTNPNGVSQVHSLTRNTLLSAFWSVSVDRKVTDAEYVIDQTGGTEVTLNWNFPSLDGTYVRWANATNNIDFNIDWKGSKTDPATPVENYTIIGLRHLLPNGLGGWADVYEDVTVVTPPHFKPNSGYTQKVFTGDQVVYDFTADIANGITPSGYYIEPADPTKTVAPLPTIRTYVAAGAIIDYTLTGCVADEAVYYIYPVYDYSAAQDGSALCASETKFTLTLKHKFEPTMTITAIDPADYTDGMDWCENVTITWKIAREATYAGTAWSFTYFNGIEEQTINIEAGISERSITVEPSTPNPFTVRLIKVVDNSFEPCHVFTPKATDEQFRYFFNIIPEPTVTVTVNDTDNVCENADFSYTVKLDNNVNNDEWSFVGTITPGDISSGKRTVTAATEVVDVAGLTPGNYTITITELKNETTGCIYTNPTPITKAFTVSQLPTVDFAFQTVGTTDACEGSEVTFVVTRTDSEYTEGDAWSLRYEYKGAPAITVNSTSKTQTFSVTAVEPGVTSEVTLIDVQNGVTKCLSVINETKEFEVLHKPVVTFEAINNPVCAGSEAEFVVTRTDGGATTNWTYNVDGVTYTVTNKVADTISLPIAADATFTLESVTNVANECTNATEIEVDVELLPAITVTFTTDVDTNAPLCQGEEVDFTITRTDDGPIDHWRVWYSVGKGVVSEDYFGTKTATVTLSMDEHGDAVEVYVLQVEVLVGGIGTEPTECETDGDTPQTTPIVFEVYPQPEVYIDAQLETCFGDDPVITITRQDEGDKTDWTLHYTLNGVATSVDVTEAEYIMTFTNITAPITVVFNKVVNNDNGCETIIDETHTINVNAIPAPEYTSNPAHLAHVCEGGDIIFTVKRTDTSKNNAWSFMFSDGTDAEPREIEVLQNTPEYTFTVVAPTIEVGKPEIRMNYSISEITDAETGCSYDGPLTITIRVHPNPVVTLTPSSDEVCAGEEITYTVTRIDGGVVSGWRYQYDIIDLATGNPVLTTQTSALVTNMNYSTFKFTPAASYPNTTLQARITALNNVNMACKKDPVPPVIADVEVNALPQVVITNDIPAVPGYICEDVPVTFTITRQETEVTNAWTVIYDLGNGEEDPINVAAGEKVATITASFETTTTVRITVMDDVTECETITYEIPVTVMPKPIVEITYAPVVICEPGKQKVVFSMDHINFDPMLGGYWQFEYIAYDVNGAVVTEGLPYKVTTSTEDLTVYFDQYVKVVITNFYDSNTGCTNEEEQVFYIEKPTAFEEIVSGSLTMCEGQEMGEAIVFGGVEFVNPAVEVVYKWECADGGLIGMTPTFGYNTIPAFTPDLFGSIVPVSVDVIVTPVIEGYLGGVDCEGVPVTFTITVNPDPTVIIPVDYALCSGEETISFEFEGRWNKLTWTNVGDDFPALPKGLGMSITKTAGLTFNFPAIALVNETREPKTAIIEIVAEYVDGHTCTVNQTLEITVNPEPVVETEQEDFPICSGNPTTAVKLEGIATSYNWTVTGDARITIETEGVEFNEVYTLDALTAEIPAITFVNKTDEELDVTITVTPFYGENTTGVEPVACEGEPLVYTITVYPDPRINDIDDFKTCDVLVINEFDFQGIATAYEWEVIETEGGEFEGLEEGKTGKGSSFGPYTLVNKTDRGIRTVVEVTPVWENEIRCVGQAITFEIIVNPIPVMDQVNHVFCHGEVTKKYDFTSSTINEHTTYVWRHTRTETGGEIGLEPIWTGVDSIPSFTAKNAQGIAPLIAHYIVTPTYEQWGVICIGETIEYTITVNPEPAQINDIADRVYCYGQENIPARTFTSTVPTALLKWTRTDAIDNDIVGVPKSDYNIFPAFDAKTVKPITEAVTFEYKVEVEYNYANEKCHTQAPVTFSITIYPQPTVNQIATPYQEYCAGAWVPSISFTGNATEYKWEIVDGPNIGSGFSGTGDIVTFQAVNAGNMQVKAVYKVTPRITGADCNAGTPIFFTIVVNPKPVMNTVNDQIVCLGNDTKEVVFTNASNSGMTYKWTVSDDSDDIGFGKTSGTGNIPSFTPTAAGEATFKVTPEFQQGTQACPGDEVTFKITVNPLPEIKQVGHKVYCNNTTADIAAFELATAVSNVTWKWEVTGSDIGLTPITGTTNKIPSFTAKNAGSTPLTATVKVTATVGTTCKSETMSFDIKVAPEPKLNKVEDRIFCTGDRVDALEFGSNVPGATFTWVKVGDTNIGLPESGSGNLPAFTTQNTTDGVLTAKYKVTVSYNLDGTSCGDAEQEFSYSVIPTPMVVTTAQTHCANDAVPAMPFEGVATTYKWSQVDGTEDIGLTPRKGEGLSFPEFVAKNNSNADVTAAFEVTPIYTHNNVTCEGKAQTFTITVKPTVTVNPVNSIVVCAGEKVEPINFSSNVEGFAYSWTSTNALAIGLHVDKGFGAIPSFVAKNNTDDAITATFEVTADACATGKVTFTITVNPIPNVKPVSNVAVCVNELVEIDFELERTINADYVTYFWTNNTPEIGIAAEGTGNISFYAKNDTYEIIVAEFTVTAQFSDGVGGPVCEGVTRNFKVTVYPKPQLISAIDAGAICSGETFYYVAEANLSPVAYKWTRPVVAGIDATERTFVGNVIDEVLVNTTTEDVVVTYHFELTYGDCVGTQDVTVVVKPAPQVVVSHTAAACASEETMSVAITTIPSNMELSYRITFGAEALAAGFVSMNHFEKVVNNAFTFAIPVDAATGIYNATVVFRNNESGCVTGEYNFSFRIYAYATNPVIVATSDKLCGTSDWVMLSIDIEGAGNLSYTWYHNDVAVATTPTYAASEPGRYYVAVEGIFCGQYETIVSNTFVLHNMDLVQQKWNDVLYVDNSNSLFTNYQWYRNGSAIVGATSQYYVSPSPLTEGDLYSAVVTFADGTKLTTCEFAAERQAPQNKVSVYPNPVATSGTLNVVMDMEEREVIGAQIEVFDMVGKRIHAVNVSSFTTQITLNATPGTYVVRIISKSGNVTTEKVVVR